MSVIVRNPKQEELATVWEVLCGAFGEEPRERFRRQIWEDSTFELEQIRIAEVDGKSSAMFGLLSDPFFIAGKSFCQWEVSVALGRCPNIASVGWQLCCLKTQSLTWSGKGTQ